MIVDENSVYIKDKITLPKVVHSHQLKTNSKTWLDNYFKNTSITDYSSDIEDSGELRLLNKRMIEYKLWLEAGKIRSSSMPKNVDLSYDFNMWRNFKKCFLEDNSNEKLNESDVIEEVAKLYPVTVPKPSKLEKNDIIKYTESSLSIHDPAKRQAIVDKLQKEKQYMDKLKLRSFSRNPPLDEEGNILPPEGYKKYQQYFYPEPLCSIEPKVANDSSQVPDVFGRINEKQFKPNLWKLTTKPRNSRYIEAMRYREKITASSKILL